jgi:MFS family permease
MLITLALGVNMPTFQFHLISYGIQEDLIGYWYMITTLAYLMSSVVLGKLNSEKYERILYSGICLYAIAYMLLGPCPHIFAKSLVLVGIGHHLVGWACSMLYSIFYVVPLVPYLIKIAKEDFNIQADDRLNDAINIIVNVSICTGEVIGPLLGSFIPSYFEQEIKFKITYCLVSLLFVVFGIFYMIFNKSSNTSRQIELEVPFLDKRNDSTSLIQSESI